MKGTWIRIVGLLVFVGGLAVVGGWWMLRGQNAPPPPPPKQQDATATAADDAPKKRTPVHTASALTLPSTIEPFEAVPVSPKLSAMIASLMVRDGSQVTKGQLLCVLDDTEIRQQIDGTRLALMQAQDALRNARQSRRLDAQTKSITLAKAQRDLDDCKAKNALDLDKAETGVARAKRDLEDAETLYAAKAASGDDVRLKREAMQDAQRSLDATKANAAATLASTEKALLQTKLDAGKEPFTAQMIQAYELALKNAQTALADRERHLADARVLAPIGGTVRIIPRTKTSAMMPSGQSAEVLGPGVRVYDGDPFLEIATTERACCRVEVDETDVARLRIGMKAKISGDAFAGRELEGEIFAIQISGRKAGEGVSLFPVTVLITSPMQGMRMGMTADVTIELNQGPEKP